MPRNNVDLTEINDLLDILSDKKTGKVINTPLIEFINYYNISSGNSKISAMALHGLYEVFSKTRIAFRPFKKYLATYVSIDDRNRVYVSQQCFDKIIPILNEIASVEAPPRKYVVDSVKNFISFKEIQSGNNWFEDYILHHWFCDWKGKRATYGLVQFTEITKLHLPYRFTSRGLYFGVSDNCLEYLTPSRVRALRARKQTNEEKNKRQKKRQVPSTRSSV